MAEVHCVIQQSKFILMCLILTMLWCFYLFLILCGWGGGGRESLLYTLCQQKWKWLIFRHFQQGTLSSVIPLKCGCISKKNGEVCRLSWDVEHISSGIFKNSGFWNCIMKYFFLLRQHYQYRTLGTGISCKTAHACDMPQASAQLKQLNATAWVGGGSGLTPKATLQSAHAVLGNSTRCICRTYASIPLLTLPLCSLSLFATPSVSKKAQCSTPQQDNHALHFMAFHLSLAVWSSFQKA